MVSLCELREWNTVESSSVLGITKMLRRVIPRIILLRYQLQDGFSDDVINAVSNLRRADPPKIIVLLPAGASSSIEARQLTLGADCVLRDPIRSEVLLAYLEKFIRATPMVHPSPPPQVLPFSAATLHPLTRTLQHRERRVVLTPREAKLVELLAGSEGEVVSYETLYNEILGCRFRGDTSNMRVLLAKLAASARKVGIDLRTFVNVIPKSGYLCQAKTGSSPRKASLIAVKAH